MFRAYDPDRDRLVAIKLFRFDLPPERVQQLVDEFEWLIATNLTHPGIAAPLAAGLDANNAAYLVQEFVAADSLDVLIRDQGPAPPAHALQLAVQLAGALDFASVVNADHGALHPRDVLISPDDTRITGLGVARALERVGVAVPVRRPYTAPERMRGAGWDRRADIFSLAALLHEMLWGRRITATGQRAAAALTAIPGADLAALRDALARGLADDPADRFETALEFAGALKAAFPAVDIQSPVRPTTDDSGLSTLDSGLSTLDSGLSTVDSRLSTLDSRLSTLDPRLSTSPLDSRLSTSPLDSRQSTLDFQEPEIRAAETARYRDVEVAPAVAPLSTLDSRRSTASPPPGLLASFGEPPSALERSRSAMWPLALALIVGIALGFGAGYGVGNRDRGVTTVAPPPTATAVAPPPPMSVPPPQAIPAGREFTETAVSESPKPAASPAPEIRPRPDTTARTRAEERKAEGITGDVGRLVVRSTPAGARVFIDGRDQGRTPATIRDLGRGPHRVRLVREGYATEERRIVVTPAHPAQSMTVVLARTRTAEPPARRAAEPPARSTAPNLPSGGSFFGSLSVESRPAGAKVFIDGRLSGTTPLMLPQVGAGEHAVRLEHDGYQRWSSSVRVMSGERNRVTASLEK